MATSGFTALPLAIQQLALSAVLKCGQSFRWNIFPLSATEGPTHEYRLCLRDRVVCLRQSPSTLFYRAVYPDPQPSPTQKSIRDAETLAWINDYFQLDIDLVTLYVDWAKRDPVFSAVKERFEGIRMLRQDPWENLVSFICSSNNNIARIEKMVKSMCRHYSPSLLSLAPPEDALEISTDTSTSLTYHPFPPPSSLSNPDAATTLRSLGFGYRASFIQRTANMLVEAHGLDCKTHSTEASERWLQTLRDRSTAEAREELLQFVGVGRKVADCILLMSLDKKEVIPVDTHVHQIAMKHYGFRATSGKASMTPKLYDAVNEKLAGIWGDYAGWAHSVLFTADLKSFSTYGLQNQEPPQTPSPTPSPSPSKRRRATASSETSSTVLPVIEIQDSEEPLGPVKKRHRK